MPLRGGPCQRPRHTQFPSTSSKPLARSAAYLDDYKHFLILGLAQPLSPRIAGAPLVSSLEELIFVSDLDELQAGRPGAFANAEVAAAILVRYFKSAPETSIP